MAAAINRVWFLTPRPRPASWAAASGVREGEEGVSGPLPCLSCPAVSSQTSGFIYFFTSKVEWNWRTRTNNQPLKPHRGLFETRTSPTGFQSFYVYYCFFLILTCLYLFWLIEAAWRCEAWTRRWRVPWVPAPSWTAFPLENRSLRLRCAATCAWLFSPAFVPPTPSTSWLWSSPSWWAPRRFSVDTFFFNRRTRCAFLQDDFIRFGYTSLVSQCAWTLRCNRVTHTPVLLVKPMHVISVLEIKSNQPRCSLVWRLQAKKKKVSHIFPDTEQLDLLKLLIELSV